MPKTEKALAAKTRKASSVTAKIAGTESAAKATSVVATATRTASIGVANRRLSMRTTKRWPWKRWVIGTTRRSKRKTTFLSGWASISCTESLRPVAIKKAPST